MDAASGSALRLKRHSALASISAHVDLERRLLLASAPGEPEVLQVPLPDARLPWLPPKAEAGGAPEGGSGDGGADLAAAACSVSVCAQTACAQRAGSVAGGEAAAAAWFSRVLDMPCRLVQQAGTLQQHPAKAQQVAATASGGQASHGRDIASLYSRGGSGPGGPRISGGGTHGSGRGGGSSFANEAQLLVVGAASLADLAARSASGEAPEVFAQRFRWGRMRGCCQGGGHAVQQRMLRRVGAGAAGCTAGLNLWRGQWRPQGLARCAVRVVRWSPVRPAQGGKVTSLLCCRY